jgi:hypothetical protein
MQFSGTAGAVTPVPAADHFVVAILDAQGPAPLAGVTAVYETSLLDDAQEPVAGVPVVLEVKAYGGSSYSVAAHAVTAPDGGASASYVVHRNTLVRWFFAGNTVRAATTSLVIHELVGVPVSAHDKASRLSRHKQVVVLGHTLRIKAGDRVSLWNGDILHFGPRLKMTRIAVGKVRPDGTFRLTAGFTHTGSKKLYVKVIAGHGYADSYSKYLHIRVR